MSLPPVPRPTITDKFGSLLAPWQSWFSQVAFYLGQLNNGATTVAKLPSPSLMGVGVRTTVTDSTATLAAGLGNVVGGTGGNTVPVYSDGSNWRIG